MVTNKKEGGGVQEDIMATSKLNGVVLLILNTGQGKEGCCSILKKISNSVNNRMD